MSDLKLPTPAAWGHHTVPITPAEIVGQLTQETKQAIKLYDVLPDGPEPCRDAPDYERVSVTLRLPETLFDQLMNGATGYRAHYSAGVETGEKFNRELVKAIAPLLVEAEHLYQDKFSRVFCQRSLCGSFTKLWYSKELTDPSAQA